MKRRKPTIPEFDTTHFRKRSAAKKMITAVPVIHVSGTIGDASRLLREHMSEFGTINYVYVVDDDFHLVGVLSIKHIFAQDPGERLISVARMTNIISVHPETDQEKVAFLALRNNVKAIPVVDQNKKLLGVVQNDSILGILYREVREDILHIAGIQTKEGSDSILDVPLFRAVRQRLLWLIIGLLGGIVAAWIVGRFEETIQTDILIAAFLPLVVYMNNAAGLQVQSLSIRDFSLSESFNMRKYFVRHFLVISIIAAIISTGAAVLGFVLFRDSAVALILLVSLAVGIVSSIITGLLIPYTLYRLKQDPAHGSGPLATSIQDIMSIIIYLLVAYSLL